MANKDSRLLTQEEKWDIYAPPVLTASQIAEHFMLTDVEKSIMASFDTTEASVYFIICYTFLKLKKTLIKFSYQDVTPIRQFIMQQEFVS